MKFKTLAAIDIGSNAIRLMIKNIESAAGVVEYNKVAFLRVPIRLGEDVFGKGYIGRGKAYRLNEALIGFSHIMKAYKVSACMAYATSAMRDAQNGQEIIEEIYRNSGIEISVISGNKEAEIILEAGGSCAVADVTANYLYVDVGGGSTEIIVRSNMQNVTARSFQIGTVRMLADKVEKREREEFKKWLETVYEQYGPLSMIASGGNINKTFKLLGKYPGETIGYPELKVLYDTLRGMDYDERILNFKLNPYRADVIIPALKIFLKVSKICKVNEIYVPKVGLVDGMIHHLYQMVLPENSGNNP